MSEPDRVAELCDLLRRDGWEPATNATAAGDWIAYSFWNCPTCGHRANHLRQGPTEAAALEELAVACGVWPAKEGE